MTTDRILEIFKEITKVPRESGHEEKIIAFLEKFAKDHNLKSRTDKVGNVYISKPAHSGKENIPGVMLQGHSDMVCDKVSGSSHDFEKDPIKYEIKDGWMIAPETTLGADCGIGVAAALAVLEDKDMPAGPVEALFTISEETGMDGAHAVQPGDIKEKILINLDSEDEGQLFIGCAGGMNTYARFKYVAEDATPDLMKCEFKIYGALGGHSGDDIDKNRCNVLKILARFLYNVLERHSDMELYEIDGGNKSNAIAREAHAVIGFPRRYRKDILGIFESTIENARNEFKGSDPDISGHAGEVGIIDVEDNKVIGSPRKKIDKDSAASLIYAMIAAPHGVISMSNDLKGLVETSTNMASVKMLKGNIVEIGTSQRSSVDSALDYAAAQTEACFALAGAVVRHEGRYPGWKPNLDSPILDVTKNAYIKLFGNEPVVRAIHAGLECGLFLTKFPDLDMISFGPTLRSVHAPGEKLDLASLEKFTKLLNEVLVNIK
ncbi:MAG: aminoacyl-histidine dipeptidase [Bacteroidales bacterium]|jgi:dipeptidase D|nr:aminoacyl-histidine dipeptidase [Bacteroidales bacterium]